MTSDRGAAQPQRRDSSIRRLVRLAAIGLPLAVTMPAAAQSPETPPIAPTSAPASERDVRTLYKDAVVAFKGGDYPLAYQGFLKVWEIEKKPKVAGNLGRAELKVGKYCGAVEHLRLFLDAEKDLPAEDRSALEQLVSEARAWLGAAEAVRRLGLSGGSYRRAAAPVATPDAIAALRAVLEGRSWGDGERDARAFAAVCAGELAASSLVPSLLALTQSPHALVAAAARSAAARLGADRQRTGALEELERFLAPEDLAVFVEWGAPPTHALG